MSRLVQSCLVRATQGFLGGVEVKPTFVSRVETKLIYQRLIKAEIGELVTYDELTQIVGTDIRKRRHWLDSAKDKAEREGYFFGPVTGQGVRRMTHDEAVALIDPTEKTQRAARKAIRRSERLDYDSMTPESRVYVTVVRATAHATLVLNSPKAAKAISASAKESQHELTVQKTLEAIKKL